MGGVLSLCFRPLNEKLHHHEQSPHNTYDHPDKPHHHQEPSQTPAGSLPRPQSYANFPSIIFHPAPDPPFPVSEQNIPHGVKYVINLAYCYKVADGDTINVDTKASNGIKETYRIRVRGVDCPESDMPYGSEARTFTERSCLRRNVSLHVWEKDQYGRIVADVITDRGLNLGYELVREGWAWWYRSCDKRKEFGRLEEEARRSRRGLWMDKEPMPPWEWRKRKKNGGRNGGNGGYGNHRW